MNVYSVAYVLKHDVSQRAPAVRGYLILRKDATSEVLPLLVCENGDR